jgi:hypothetical protein
MWVVRERDRPPTEHGNDPALIVAARRCAESPSSETSPGVKDGDHKKASGGNVDSSDGISEASLNASDPLD